MWSNFVQQAAAAVQDGWDDDDDDDDDGGEDFMQDNDEYDDDDNNQQFGEGEDEKEDEESSYPDNEQQQEQQQHDHDQHHPRGVLVGTLSRFLERVAHPNDDEEEIMTSDNDGVEDGWDDDIVDVIDDDDDQYEEEEQVVFGNNEANVGPLPAQPLSQATLAPELHGAPHPVVVEDDDDAAEEEEEEVAPEEVAPEQAPAPQQTEEQGDEDEKEDAMFQGSGWGGEEDLDFVDMEQQHDPRQPEEIASPLQNQPLPCVDSMPSPDDEDEASSRRAISAHVHEASQRLDDVLHEIDALDSGTSGGDGGGTVSPHPEAGLGEAMTATTSALLTAAVSPHVAAPTVVSHEQQQGTEIRSGNASDDDMDREHYDQAVLEMQQEMQRLEENPPEQEERVEDTAAVVEVVEENAWNDDMDDLDLADSFSSHPVVVPENAIVAVAAIEEEHADAIVSPAPKAEVIDLEMNQNAKEEENAWAEDDLVLPGATLEHDPNTMETEAGPPPPPTNSNDTPVVDHTPHDKAMKDEELAPSPEETDPSLSPQVDTEDRTRDTGPPDESGDELIYDDENEDAYGPIVDHTPLIHPHIMTRQDSLAVQAAMRSVGDDIDDEDALDQTDNGWDEEEEDDILLEEEELEATGVAAEPPEPHMVDQLPVDQLPADHADEHQSAADLSVNVLPSVADTDIVDPDMTADDTDDNLLDTRYTFGPMVDQTPQRAGTGEDSSVSQIRAPPMSASQSMAVQTAALAEDFAQDDAMDETVEGGLGREEDDEKEEEEWAEMDVMLDEVIQDVGNDMDRKTTSSEGAPSGQALSEELPPAPSLVHEKTHVVDHTPSEFPSSCSQFPANIGGDDAAGDRSLIVQATVDDLTRDSGVDNDEVYDDENELDYVPVVDHTPQMGHATDTTETTSSVVHSAIFSVNSLAVHAEALDEDFQDDDAMDETCFADSTVAGNTLDGATLGDVEEAPDGWDQDDPDVDDVIAEEEGVVGQKGDQEEHMVDQTPSELGSPAPKNADPSVAVLASIEENDSVIEETPVYGPVVDHTPVTPAFGRHSTRSDSVIVQAADQETVDESTVEGDDGDTIDDEMPGALPSLSEAEAPPLVDYVPPRPESRFGDASTLVAADPSEVLSSVDDMAIEENNYGPVVDVTPPAQAVVQPILPSAAGSTAVFASASVGAVDLDDADETEANADDGWAHEDPNLEETPNPQSGNEEPPRVNEQVVDFLPPPVAAAPPLEGPEEISTVGDREASSEYAVGGALSLLQPEDPKEDDFGPVVDLTPMPRPSMPQSGVSSTGTQVTASEISRLEKDDNTEGRSVGSKSGAVVDHVPQMSERINVDSLATAARSQFTEDEEEETDSKFGPVVDHLPTPRASLAPSRGGSTVDALATVSEVDSVDGEGNGWEDDLDIDGSDNASDRTDRVSQTTGYFRRMASASSEQDRGMSVRFDSSVRDSRSDMQPRHVADREAASEADTLSHSSIGQESSGWAEDSKPKAEEEDLVPTNSFADAETPPSTPHQRPSRSRFNDGRRGGTSLMQPSLESPLKHNTTGTQTLESPTVEKLLEMSNEKGYLYGTLVTSEGISIQVDFGKLLRDEIVKRQLVEKEASALRSVCESQTLESSLKSSRESELETELSEMRQSNDYMLERIESVQAEAATFRDKSSQLGGDLASSQRHVSDLEKAKEDWLSNQSTYENEIQVLKHALEEARAKIVSSESGSAQITALQRDMSLKNGECHQLNTQIVDLQQRLEIKEQHVLEKGRECDVLMTKLQEDSVLCGELEQTQLQLKDELQHLEALKKDVEEAMGATKAELQVARAESQDLARKLAELQQREESSEKTKAEVQDALWASREELEKVLNEKDALTKTLRQTRDTHEKEVQKQYELIDKRDHDIGDLEGRLKASDTEKAELAESLLRQKNIMAEESEKLANELLSVAKERDLLREAQAESNEAVSSLQKLVDEHGMEREVLNVQRDQEIVSLREKVKQLTDSVNVKSNEIERYAARLKGVDAEKESAVAKTLQLENLCASLKAAAEASQSAVAMEESKTEQLHLDFQSLQAAYDETTRQFQDVEAERLRLVSRVDEIGRECDEAKKSAHGQQARVSELETELKRTKDQLMSFASEKDAIVSERNSIDAQYRELHSNSSRAITEAQELARRYEEEAALLKEECGRLQRDVEAQRLASQDLDETYLQLDALSKQRDSLVEDNEEMLVQFGLLKEQMDISNTQLRYFENDMNILYGLIESVMTDDNGAYDSSAVSKLSDDNRKILEVVHGLRESNVEFESHIKDLSREKDRADAESERNEQLSYEILELRNHCQRLESDCAIKQEEVDRLNQQLATSGVNSETVSEYGIRIEQLQAESSQKDRLLEAKDVEISAVQERLGQIQTVTQELHDARIRMHEMEIQLQTGVDRIRDLEGYKESVEVELRSTKEQLEATTSALCSQSEQSFFDNAVQDPRVKAGLASRRDTAAVIANYEKRLKELESELGKKAAKVCELERNVDALEIRKSQRSGEEVGAKDKEISSLRSQLDSLNEALQATRSRLASKEEDVDRLHGQLRDLRDKQMQTASDVLEGKTDEVESLKSHVVSLAVALERSENRRAEALDSLNEERKTNADSLRRLAESVKRFYSSVSFGDV